MYFAGLWCDGGILNILVDIFQGKLKKEYCWILHTLAWPQPQKEIFSKMSLFYVHFRQLWTDITNRKFSQNYIVDLHSGIVLDSLFYPWCSLLVYIGLFVFPPRVPFKVSCFQDTDMTEDVDTFSDPSYIPDQESSQGTSSQQSQALSSQDIDPEGSK